MDPVGVTIRSLQLEVEVEIDRRVTRGRELSNCEAIGVDDVVAGGEHVSLQPGHRHALRIHHRGTRRRSQIDYLAREYRWTHLFQWHRPPWQLENSGRAGAEGGLGCFQRLLVRLDPT